MNEFIRDLSYFSPTLSNVLSFFWGAGGIIVGLFALIFIIRIINSIRNTLRRGKNILSENAKFMSPPDMGMRGKTKEQKRVVRYFGTITLIDIFLGCVTYGIWFIYIFFFRRMSNTAFDELLNSKADELASKIEERTLETHGVDTDEVKEIPPILTESFYNGSRYFKMFKDHSFRASEYQMTYLMFSEKQVFVYSNIFDLTSANTTEQTKEYFYEDITTIDVSKKQTEFPDFRLLKGYLLSGIASLVIGYLIFMFSAREIGAPILGGLFQIAGMILIILSVVLGFSRRLVDSLILRLTVSNDEFVCVMKPESIEAIQGMKAKIRDKKG